MKSLVLAVLLGASALGLSACGLAVVPPMEAPVAKVVGYNSVWEKYVLDPVGEFICGEPRDEVTGDCGDGDWSDAF